MSVIYALLVGHFVADFLCQSDWMALNKGKRWDALALHVGIYWGVLMLFVLADHAVTSGIDTPIGAGMLVFAAVNFVAHFVQDAITSRITSKLWFLPQVGQGVRPNWIQVEVKQSRHWFFVAIGADQLLHYVTLFVTAGWWL